MTVKDTFTKLATHQLEGLMFHSALADAFASSHLDGFRVEQIHQFEEEAKIFFATKTLMSKHVNESLPDLKTDYRPDIPQDDIQKTFSAWLDWEKKTYQFYATCHSEMVAAQDLVAAKYISFLCSKVDLEIEHIRQEILRLTSVDWDKVKILDWQDNLYSMYHGKEYDWRC